MMAMKMMQREHEINLFQGNVLERCIIVFVILNSMKCEKLNEV